MAAFSVNNTRATQVGYFNDATSVQISVQTAGQSVYVARDRSTLETPPPAGGQAGIVVTQAGGTGQLTWKGAMWMIGSAAVVQGTIEYP